VSVTPTHGVIGGGKHLLLQQRLHDGERRRVHGLPARRCGVVAHVGVDDLQLRGVSEGVAAVAQRVQQAA
jgi:hypothetical protein